MDRIARDGTSIASTAPALARGMRLRRWLLALGLGGSALLLAACSMPPQNVSRSSQESPVTAATTVAAAPSMEARVATPQQANSTLGTQWGEGRSSPIIIVDSTRLTPHRPQAQSSMRYTDEDSIRRALGSNADRQLSVLLADGKIEWSVVNGNGSPLPIYSSRDDANYQIAGREGERYVLVYANRSQRDYELIATVDGLDVLTGKPGSIEAEGYLLRGGATLRIEGFRKSQNEVASFRFSAKGGAYAANTPSGNVRNVGVIGAAVFEVRVDEASLPAPMRRGAPAGADAFPADGGRFASPPPRYR